MTTIFEAIEIAKDFFAKLWNIGVAEININKVTRTIEGWKVEALYLGREYHVVVNGNKEVQSYEKKEVVI